jgi:uncharacterized protein (DUF305 family)
MSIGSGVSCCVVGDRMLRRRKVLLFTAVAVAAIVLGVVSTLALAGWPQERSLAASPWNAGPMGWGMGGVGVEGEFDYLTHMVAHHEEAVDAARQLERSGRAEMRALGTSIVTTQTAEITKMNARLAEWYPGRSATLPYQPMMRDLSRLSGDALDEAFLQDMIPHHMAAVMASQQLLVHSRIQHQEVTDFARAVRDDQHTEIFQMQRYLADWFGGGWEMPYGAGLGGSSTPGAGNGPCGPGGMMGR